VLRSRSAREKRKEKKEKPERWKHFVSMKGKEGGEAQIGKALLGTIKKDSQTLVEEPT